jgi:hypothetical protein
MKLHRLIPSIRLGAKLICICSFLAGVAYTQEVSPPTIKEVRIVTVGADNASFSVTVARNGAGTSVAIEYGTTTSYGTATTVFDDPAATEGEFTASIPISGLTQGTRYYYRGAASNTAGTVTSEGQSFIAGNQPPLATQDQFLRRDGSGPFELLVLSNDFDPEHAPLQILSVTQGAHGSVAINTGAETVSYTLTDAGYVGSDIFTYTIGDGSGATATGSVTIQLGHQLVTTEILFATGDPVPGAGIEGSGIPADATFETFGIPSVNQVGQVGFSARILWEGIVRSVIIAPNAAGEHSVLLRAGDAATDAAGEPLPITFAGLHHPMLNEAGNVAFIARVAGAGVNESNDLGIWLKVGPELRLVAREGGVAPGVPAGAVFDSFESVALITNEAPGSQFPVPPQAVAFVARLRIGTGGVTSADDRGLWLYQHNTEAEPTLTLLLREGSELDLDPLDQLPGPIVASFIALRTQTGAAGQGNGLVMDQHNRRTFHVLARVRFAEHDFATVEFTGDSGTPILVSRPDEFASLGIPTQSVDGQNAFTGKRRISLETGTTSENDGGVYVANDLDTSSAFRVVTEGDSVPDVEGAHFARFQNVVNNGAGYYAFTGMVAGSGITETNDSGIWFNDFTGLRSVAREGGSVPGLAGATFTEFQSLAMPSNGRIILKARITKQNGVLRSGVWFTDDDFALRLAIREGDVIPGDRGGRVRVIRILESVFESPAQTRSFNRRGEMIYRVSLDAGRQAIMKSTMPGVQVD